MSKELVEREALRALINWVESHVQDGEDGNSLWIRFDGHSVLDKARAALTASPAPPQHVHSEACYSDYRVGTQYLICGYPASPAPQPAPASTVAQGLQKLVDKWSAEANRLHDLVPDERLRDSRREGLLECAADIVAFTAANYCGAPVPQPAPEPPKIIELGVGDVAYGVAERAIKENWTAARLGPEIAKLAIDYAIESISIGAATSSAASLDDWAKYIEFECSCANGHECHFHQQLPVELEKAKSSGYSGTLANWVAARNLAYGEGAIDADQQKESELAASLARVREWLRKYSCNPGVSVQAWNELESAIGTPTEEEK